MKEILAREKDGQVEVHKDAGFAENPMDREDVVEAVKAEGVRGLGELLASCKAPSGTIGCLILDI